MKVYLVGGAVRDELLGLPVKEKDYVVVGATAEMLAEKGFKPVGKTFPVFLHPKTQEEYALARTEKKVGQGYHGFTFFADPSVTLEEDLLRRDLTINAIAKDDEGALIDPYHGQADIQKKQLRHVSPAFSEDPVRLLRIARFLARFKHLGFSIAPETKQLLKEIVQRGETKALIAERVWQECEKALGEKTPAAFFETLQEAGAFGDVFAVSEKFDISAGIKRLEAVSSEVSDKTLRLAAFLWTELSQAKAIFEKLKAPSLFLQRALQCHQFAAVLFEHPWEPAAILKLIKSKPSLLDPEILKPFVITTARLQGHSTDKVSTIVQTLQTIQNQLAMIQSKPLIEQGITGPALGKALEQLALEKIKISL